MNNVEKLALCFLVGVMSLQLMSELPQISYLMALFVFLVVVYKRFTWLSVAIFGFVWASVYALIIDTSQLPKAIEGQEILIYGQVVDLPIKDERATKFLFHVDGLASLNSPVFPKKIRLSWYGRNRDVRSGEKWQFLVKLKQSHGLANPHGFDYEKWLFQQNIGATGYIRESNDNVRIDLASKWSVSYWREQLKDYIEATLPNSQHASVIKALVLGDRSDISAKQWDVFRKTGTSHLIAISGLHIGLISALFFGITRWLCLRVRVFNQRATQYAIIAGLIAAAVYAALAGFSIPTQRALIMLSVVFGGIYWQRHYRPFHVICVALVLVLMYDPLSVMSAGFWLSFGAVAVILFGMVGRIGQLPLMHQLVRTQWYVTLGLMPLVLYFFQQVSIIAPLANFLAVPWVSLIVIPALIMTLPLGLVSTTLSDILLAVINNLIHYLWVFLNVLADIEYSHVVLPSVPVWVCAFSLMGVLLMLLPKGFVPRYFALFLFVPLVFPMKASSVQNGDYKLVLLDVGQGLSAIIHTATHTLVFDTGASYGDKANLATSVILPYLNGEQVKQVDTLVISHGDNDHAGGAKTLLENIDVKSVLTSVPEIFNGYPANQCIEGQRWQWDGVSFEFLNPSSFDLFDGNNGSCVLKVSSPKGSVLLTGDIEKSVEESLLQYMPNKLQSDILIAPHHGSNTSSSLMFIEAVNPQYVLFPVGYKNRFGFPKTEVLERYRKIEVGGLDTANHGALSVTFDLNNSIIVESYRKNNAKFWNWQP
ncbi:MAG: DNA internalization-related competence protein ComEC/Rec2 [Cycloclasticus sp.]|nr:MAG: DNA internalization-related competence protein ComEC/Rec2 [Cycloclasticus sp.]